ncbi:MAG TPA: (2Fe-2S)-binding protein [Chloroflexota bacterium]|nr:(2Fe-2S)-binding protein [Chloroflexota bacterium]
MKWEANNELLCPQCGHQGRPVERLTLKALLRPDALARLDVGAAYRFCATADCPVVYFTDQGGSVYHKADLEVRVGQKETAEPIPLCYCFGHTRASVREEIERTGKSPAPTSIAAHIKAGRCGCDVNNPSGACCLGEVNKAVKEFTR